MPVERCPKQHVLKKVKLVDGEEWVCPCSVESDIESVQTKTYGSSGPSNDDCDDFIPQVRKSQTHQEERRQKKTESSTLISVAPRIGDEFKFDEFMSRAPQRRRTKFEDTMDGFDSTGLLVPREMDSCFIPATQEIELIESSEEGEDWVLRMSRRRTLQGRRTSSQPRATCRALRPLFRIMLAQPGTTVSVERGFST
eukprot:gene22490-8978_t